MRVFLTGLLLGLFWVGSAESKPLGNPDVYIGKLPNQGNYFFKVDEIPANLTVYWDFNEDGFPDTVFGCPLLGSGRIFDCGKRIKKGDDEYIFSSCPARQEDYDRELKHYYYITRKECWECLSCKAWIRQDTKHFPKSIRKRTECNLND